MLEVYKQVALASSADTPVLILGESGTGNIRNPETEKLAEALARLTGETKTAAVTHALRVDSSALLAVLQDEAERRAFNEAMEAAGSLTMSVASFVEASIVIEVRHGAEGLRALDRFVDRVEMSS